MTRLPWPVHRFEAGVRPNACVVCGQPEMAAHHAKGAVPVPWTPPAPVRRDGQLQKEIPARTTRRGGIVAGVRQLPEPQEPP